MKFGAISMTKPVQTASQAGMPLVTALSRILKTSAREMNSILGGNSSPDLQ